MAKRVFELARELGVKSKDVLEKCRAEGLEVKNHMASVSAGLEATIREWFSEDPETVHTAVETTDHVDVKKARARAKKTRRKPTKDKEGETPTTEKEPEQTQETPPEAETPQATSDSEETAPPRPEPVAQAEAPEDEADEAEPLEEQPEEPATPPAPSETAVAANAEEPQEQASEQAQPEAEEPEDEGEDQDDKDSEENITPAGPQVVPKPAKLKGPRVVRVERPDYVPRPQPRASTPRPGPAPSQKNLREERTRTSEGDSRTKRGRKRSPRRRSNRSGESTSTREQLKEWRERDLLERSERIAGAGGTLRRRRATVSRGRSGGAGSSIKTGKVEIEEPISIKSLSAATGMKAADLIKRLMMEHQTMATVNQVISTELAESLVVDYDIELVVKWDKSAEEELTDRLGAREKTDMETRAPVVTFLGHVDHGKTSLLDRIRQTSVADGEAGGITQAIGAHRHDKGDQHVVFLDTPGHEAFTAMRARGANMTDVVVLVVAADDGVMPQTIEAISHAKAAGVPIVVALNKIDVPNANIQRALGQLAEHDLQPQEWGGDVEVVRTSAETGEGVEELVELLSLEAEILEIKAERDAPASGYVVESRMDPGMGVVATVLNLNGTLRVGDTILAGSGFGRVRQIYSDKGKTLQEAGPAMPAAITGLDEVPEAGDRFYVVEDLDEARAVAEERRQNDRRKTLAASASAPRSLAELIGQIESGETNEIPIILKADVQGSVEAIVGTLSKLGSDETRLNVLHAGVGGITTGDVALAEASGAIIIGFNVVAAAEARREADAHNIDIRLYRVIYDITEDMRRALEEGLEPEIREETLGQAEVRQLFKISRLGTIAGCFVTDGVAQRNAKVRIIRNNVVVEDERELESLRRVKDDVREVRNGMECGVKIRGYDDLKEGDVLEFYREVEVARTLS